MSHYQQAEATSESQPFQPTENTMLEEKLDALIVAMNKNTEALHAAIAAGGGATGAVAAAADKPARANKIAKVAEVKPTTDMATLKGKFEELKATSTNMPALKQIIADVGFTSLAELLNTPAKYDEAFGKLTDLEASLVPVAADDDL